VAAGVERIDQPVDRSGGRGRRRAESESHSRDPVRVDAEQARRRRVLCGRLDRVPEPRPVEQQHEPDDQHDGQGERVEPDDRHPEAGDDPAVVLVAGLNRAIRREIDERQRALDAERDGERDEQREIGRLVLSQRPQKRQLHKHPEAEQQRCRDEDGHERVDAESREERKTQVRREDHQRALGEVHHPHDAEDQRLPGRHQRVHTTDEHAENDGLNQCVHRRTFSRPRRAGR
jgi:hypothetical protein